MQSDTLSTSHIPPPPSLPPLSPSHSITSLLTHQFLLSLVLFVLLSHPNLLHLLDLALRDLLPSLEQSEEGRRRWMEGEEMREDKEEMIQKKQQLS